MPLRLTEIQRHSLFGMCDVVWNFHVSELAGRIQDVSFNHVGYSLGNYKERGLNVALCDLNQSAVYYLAPTAPATPMRYQ